jgi:hydrogenase maturation protein HypF
VLGGEIDWRPLLRATIEDRVGGRDPGEISRAFHGGLASGLAEATATLCRDHGLGTAVASGGVMQNALLLERLAALLERGGITLLINHLVPPNDGGISLGQAALGALGPCTNSPSR